MADDIVTITFQNDTLTDNSGATARLTGSVQVDYTTKSYSGTYRLSGSGINAQGSLANSGGLTLSNGQYTITDGSLTVSYVGEQPSTAVTETYNIPGIPIGDSTFGGDTYTGTDQPLASVACYVAGTLIRTPNGDVPVESLTVGDLVVTVSGAWRPIRWLGRRSYVGRFANRNRDVLPICFKAGCIADNVPARDLWVSPKHAMYIDGMLVPAEHLVDGVSVIQAEKVDRVEYHHVELDSHDLLLAEGAASESFVEDGDHRIFHNASDRPRRAGRNDLEAEYCAPRIEQGQKLEAIRGAIAARAGALSRIAA